MKQAIAMFLALVFQLCQNAFTQNLDSGLVGYWTFDDGPGSTVARDSSGHYYEFTLENMDIQSAWVAGCPSVKPNGYALRFDGNDDYLLYARNDAAAFDFAGATAFSVAMWINVTQLSTKGDYPGGYPLMSQWVPQTDDKQLWQFFLCTESPKKAAAGDELGFATYRATPDINCMERRTINSNLAAGTWYHVAVTWAASTQPVFYKNGQPMSISFSYQTSPSAIDHNGMGKNVPIRFGYPTFHSTEPYYYGIMDDVRFYNRVLSANEIHLLANPVTGIRKPKGRDVIFKEGGIINSHPFNSLTEISWPDGPVGSVIRIYDIHGRLVKNLENKKIKKCNLNADRLESGTYLIRVEAGNTLYTKKLIILQS